MPLSSCINGSQSLCTWKENENTSSVCEKESREISLCIDFWEHPLKL